MGSVYADAHVEFPVQEPALCFGYSYPTPTVPLLFIPSIPSVLFHTHVQLVSPLMSMVSTSSIADPVCSTVRLSVTSGSSPIPSSFDQIHPYHQFSLMFSRNLLWSPISGLVADFPQIPLFVLILVLTVLSVFLTQMWVDFYMHGLAWVQT